MNATYWLGVATFPALAGILYGALFVTVRTFQALENRGHTLDIKTDRKPSQVSEYTLRNDIWWERSFGPVFVGGWNESARTPTPTQDDRPTTQENRA